MVADIVRAIDDKVANELMFGSFKRQLLMDEQYHENFVTFVMTKTVQITTHEVISSLKLETGLLNAEVAQEIRLTNELQALKDALSQHKQEQKDFKHDLKKSGNTKSSAKYSLLDGRKRSPANAKLC